MYDLTSKNFEQLPEVKKRKEEEKRKEEFKARKEKAKQLDQVMRDIIFSLLIFSFPLLEIANKYG